MALVNVIKYEAPSDEDIVWKYPSDKILLASQLIVNEGQQAVFVKGGQALDIFGPGTHTLTTANIPIIQKIINLPFGGDTPFSAEIWYINTTVKRDLKWGTKSPIPLMDPSLGFPVSLRSFGKWGVRIRDVRPFITQIIGSQTSGTASKVNDYFIGEITQSLIKCLSDHILKNKISVMEVGANLDQISSICMNFMKNEFQKFGVELINFNIESVNIPDEEMKKIQAVFEKKLEAEELSKANIGGAYGAIKTFEVLKDAAQNPGDNTIGSMLGAGVGLGAGFPLGEKMGRQLDTSTGEKTDEKEKPEDRLLKLKKLLDDKIITEEQFNLKREEILKDL